MWIEFLAFVGSFYIGKEVFHYFFPDTYHKDMISLLEAQLKSKSTRLKELEEQLECILMRTKIN